MKFKNFFIWIIKNLIILLVATLIFSTVTLDFPNLMKGVFGDIFAYASPEVQKQTISKLTETCSSLDQGQSNYFTPDLGNIGALCKDYKSGKINDKEFFFYVVSSPFSSQQVPKMGVFEGYNNAISYLNKNKIIYLVILAILIMELYSLISDHALFWRVMGGISLNLGLLMMLPYFAILIYDKFVGIDTTPILGSIFGVGNFVEPRAIISVILLLFLRTYNAFIITIGIVFLAVGTVIKTHQKLHLEDPEKIKIKKKGQKC